MRLLAAIGFCLLVLFALVFVFGLRGPVAVAVELAAIGLMIAADRWYSPRIDRWLQGARGEQSVGMILDGLSAQGWLAIHDVSLGRGNVDHVLIGPGGVFTIETKSNRGRIRIDRIESRMLKQACVSLSPSLGRANSRRPYYPLARHSRARSTGTLRPSAN